MKTVGGEAGAEFVWSVVRRDRRAVAVTDQPLPRSATPPASTHSVFARSDTVTVRPATLRPSPRTRPDTCAGNTFGSPRDKCHMTQKSSAQLRCVTGVGRVANRKAVVMAHRENRMSACATSIVGPLPELAPNASIAPVIEKPSASAEIEPRAMSKPVAVNAPVMVIDPSASITPLNVPPPDAAACSRSRNPPRSVAHSCARCRRRRSSTRARR